FGFYGGAHGSPDGGVGAKKGLHLQAHAQVAIAGLLQKVAAFGRRKVDGFQEELLNPIPVVAGQSFLLTSIRRKMRLEFLDNIKFFPLEQASDLTPVAAMPARRASDAEPRKW